MLQRDTIEQKSISNVAEGASALIRRKVKKVLQQLPSILPIEGGAAIKVLSEGHLLEQPLQQYL